MNHETGALVPADTGGEEFSDFDRFEFQIFEKFKEIEYKIYKERHAVVLNDNGIAQLKKTAFKMPGYKKIIGTNLNEYEIDNQVLFTPPQFASPNSGRLDVEFIPEELSNTDCSFDNDAEATA